MAEWELSKENVQPLRKGRKDVELLDQGLRAKTDAAAQSALNEQRRILLEEIDNYNGDDPLEPWLKCIAWTKEAYPSGGTQSGILQMLELCLRTFCSIEKYKEDPRYVKLWMEYADRCNDPKDIFKFLEANDIGQTHAIFYESYARYLERCKSFTKANDVFQVGISRLGDSDELKNKYRDFLERSAKHSEDVNVDDEDVCIRAFGGLSAPRGLRTISQGSTSKLAVFVDDDFQPAGRKVAHEVKKSTNAPWSNLGTQAEKNKENVQQPSKWTKAKVQVKPSTSAVRVVPAPALDVFVDDEFLSKEPQRRCPVTSRLKVRPDFEKEAEAIRQEPLRNFVDGFR